MKFLDYIIFKNQFSIHANPSYTKRFSLLKYLPHISNSLYIIYIGDAI